ncbi:MAG: ATP-binding protein [Taibaiella sp.]|jgi:hypothetical protein
MIQKEDIETRRRDLAELRHADSVYRDITERLSERDDYEKRWLWELLQNAKDSAIDGETVKIKIEIEDNKISFSHTGAPFELDDILSLIIQGSSKSGKNKVGRFGTGFMTTYLLSQKVGIAGQLTHGQGCFDFILNREAADNEEFYRFQQESNDSFSNSIADSSYLDDAEFQTRFTYMLDERGQSVAKAGLACLDELIPITQLFNTEIDAITVVGPGQIKTFSKLLLYKHTVDDNHIEEWQVSSIINKQPIQSFKAYIHRGSNYESCIITHLVEDKEAIYPFTINHPRLFFTFPLIGTEEIGISIIINSTAFKPKVERDGVYLKQSDDGEAEKNNRQIINDALQTSTLLFAKLCAQKGIESIYELFKIGAAKDLKWVDQDWLNIVKKIAVEALAVLPVIRFFDSKQDNTALVNFKVPYAADSAIIQDLWELLSQIEELKVPLQQELQAWVDTIGCIAKITTENGDPFKSGYVWGIKELIRFTEQKNSLEQLAQSLSENPIVWLNKLYTAIRKSQEGRFPLESKILLNHKNCLRNAEGCFWDHCKDDKLNNISDQIGLNFSDKLISTNITQFHIAGVEAFKEDNAITELKLKFNSFSEADFANTSYIACSAMFLNWLIEKEHTDLIRDLKVLSGASKKSDEKFVYDQFPKTEHLWLSSKPYWQHKFPEYAGLVRDKDCLHEQYNLYLSAADYTFLSQNGFIHLEPLVIKTETANQKILELLVLNEQDLNILKDAEGQLKYRFKVTYSDFAYLTSTDGHIYSSRSSTSKSSLDRLRFLLIEAVERDMSFENDTQEIFIEELGQSITLRQSLWVYRAKRLNWINVKTVTENGETKFNSETPSSKNLSELLKLDDSLVQHIRGAKQQQLLQKLGIGVSDLIRNTLPSEDLKLSWDKAITNMITSGTTPELAQEIFSDPNIQEVYANRIKNKKLIDRNQKIGALIERLFKEYIEKLQAAGHSVYIDREPFGSDYILTEESSDLINDKNELELLKINGWLIELKATGKDYAAMTPLQAETATTKSKYALIVVPLDGSDPDIEYIRANAKVVITIGDSIKKVYPDFKNLEIQKNALDIGKEGISISIEDQNVRFKVSSSVWNGTDTTIELFINTYFRL